ncbi:MAG: glycosyltransferase family protein [Deltaproteobacteria bacterium]|nr:glycosyltransferase family protein [Deltaproteobacteria bacterium]MCL5276182.1 glycosyltransferase family protein [Deltaproteobacteria bacterium]
MISIICVYNNKDILENYLLKSLKTQTTKFELIPIDNTNYKFKSASKALNFGGEKANNKYIMFVHQDVELVSASWLQDVEQYLDSIQNLGIAGVAGVAETGNTDEERARNVIRHGPDYHVWGPGNSINTPEPVQTLDGDHRGLGYTFDNSFQTPSLPWPHSPVEQHSAGSKIAIFLLRIVTPFSQPSV